MLNKKAQFMENVDLIAGVLLFILGIVLFSLFSASTEDANQEQLELELEAFEQNNHTMDLINLVSDPQILELLTDFEGNTEEYLNNDLIRMDTTASIMTCNDQLYEKFKELIPADTFYFLASKGDDNFFVCYHNINTDKEIVQIITIPSTDPENPITVRLNMEDE